MHIERYYTGSQPVVAGNPFVPQPGFDPNIIKALVQTLENLVQWLIITRGDIIQSRCAR
jgi:hypothetical protein